MSHKKAPLYTKILIDIDEYYKLLEVQHRVNKQEEQINARLEKDVTNSAPPKIVPTSIDESNSEQVPEQSGSGSVPNSSLPFSEDIVKHISNLVTQQLANQFQLQPKVPTYQEGSGANDLFPELPEPIIDNNTHENAPTSLSIVHKSVPHDEFDNSKLISLVPKRLKTRAAELLEKLAKFSNDITWTSNGVIFIDQNSLPDSNIYEIFPQLFRTPSAPDKIMYLNQIATKIASLGFGHLLSKSLTYGLIRKRNIANENEIMTEIKTAKNWWYLGP